MRRDSVPTVLASVEPKCRVGDHRRPIPVKIKLAVLIAQARCTVCGERLGSLNQVEFDHRPALVNREFDAAVGDFIPPQLDPDHIEAVHCECHLYRTTGRRPGAAKTVDARGSDRWEAKRTARKERKRLSPAPSRWLRGRKIPSRSLRRAI